MEHHLSFFGTINSEKLEEYYEVDIDFGDRTIQVDINFENQKIDNPALDFIQQHLNSLEELNSKNLTEINQDFLNNGFSFDYVSGIANEVDTENFHEIIQSLFLKRIGFYPEIENAGIVCDYTIGEDLTDDILVIFRKLDGKFDGISIES